MYEASKHLVKMFWAQKLSKSTYSSQIKNNLGHWFFSWVILCQFIDDLCITSASTTTPRRLFQRRATGSNTQVSTFCARCTQFTAVLVLCIRGLLAFVVTVSDATWSHGWPGGCHVWSAYQSCECDYGRRNKPNLPTGGPEGSIVMGYLLAAS